MLFEILIAARVPLYCILVLRIALYVIMKLIVFIVKEDIRYRDARGM